MKIGPIAKPSAGSTKAPAATAPALCEPTVMNLRRVIVSPSKAPGILRSSVYLDLFAACLSDTGAEQYRGPFQRGVGRSAALVRIASTASGAPANTRSLARRCASVAPQPTARAPASQTASASAGRPALWASADERDRVGQLGDRRRVAERTKPRQTDRVQLITGEQAQIGLGRADDARRAVVEQIALVDRLNEQLVLLAPPRRARPARDNPPDAPGRVGRRPVGLAAPLGTPLRTTSVASSPPSSRSSVARRCSASALMRSPPAARRRAQTPPSRPAPSDRAAPTCEPATRTTPRTGTAADRHHAQQLPAPQRVRLQITGRRVLKAPHRSLAEEHCHQAGRAHDLHGLRRRRPRASPAPAAR